jgi:hypothetical protein
MRESLFIGIIAILAVALIATRRRHRRVPLLGKLTEEIDVKLTWKGDNLEIDVEPGCAEVAKGKEIRWTHNADRLQVQAKGAWPYLNTSADGGRGKPARSGSMRPDPTLDKAYPYSITLHTERPGNPPRPFIIKIDPDIIIRQEKLNDYAGDDSPQ